ncbi:hypothetical protein ACFLZ5_04585 [Thermodesulfobacteriota bacterium]
MGGLGSGTWLRRNTKKTVDSKYKIDVRLLNKDGWLETSTCGALTIFKNQRDSIAVAYEKEADCIVLQNQYCEIDRFSQKIELTQTSCHYGGKRPWFECPTCKNRVAVLYFCLSHFQCRKCSNLTYPCQKEREVFRLFRKARKIRKQLNASTYWEISIRVKPKGMHNKTFNRLRCKSIKTENQMWGFFSQELNTLGERISDIKSGLFS